MRRRGGAEARKWLMSGELEILKKSGGFVTGFLDWWKVDGRRVLPTSGAHDAPQPVIS